MQDPCPDPTQASAPTAVDAFPELPARSGNKLKQVCPYYDGKDVCCNDDQIDTLYINFQTIDALFGDCPLCTTNLKRMWCEFTCNPYQKYFIDYTGLWPKEQVPDYGFDLANMTYRIGSD